MSTVSIPLSLATIPLIIATVHLIIGTIPLSIASTLLYSVTIHLSTVQEPLSAVSELLSIWTKPLIIGTVHLSTLTELLWKVTIHLSIVRELLSKVGVFFWRILKKWLIYVIIRLRALYIFKVVNQNCLNLWKINYLLSCKNLKNNQIKVQEDLSKHCGVNECNANRRFTLTCYQQHVLNVFFHQVLHFQTVTNFNGFIPF